MNKNVWVACEFVTSKMCELWSVTLCCMAIKVIVNLWTSWKDVKRWKNIEKKKRN